MANQVFNIALGRVVEWAIRIDGNDPANSVFVLHAWVVTATDATVKDVDDVAALEATALVAEATNGGYAPIEVAASITFAPDDGNDRTDVDFPDQTFSSVAAGDVWSDLSISYDSDSLAGTDANIVLGTWHDFIITPNGGDITAQLDAAGFFRAS